MKKVYGAIVGDIVGSVYEFNNIKTKKFPFFGKQEGQSEVSSGDQELIMQLLANPQAMTLLKSLAKAL